MIPQQINFWYNSSVKLISGKYHEVSVYVLESIGKIP